MDEIKQQIAEYVKLEQTTRERAATFQAGTVGNLAMIRDADYFAARREILQSELDKISVAVDTRKAGCIVALKERYGEPIEEWDNDKVEWVSNPECAIILIGNVPDYIRNVVKNAGPLLIPAKPIPRAKPIRLPSGPGF